MQGVLGVEGEMTEAQEGTSGGVATSLPRASFPAISRTAVTVPTGRCTGQAAELLCEVTWLPEARRGCATIRRSRATHPVPHGRHFGSVIGQEEAGRAAMHSWMRWSGVEGHAAVEAR